MWEIWQRMRAHLDVLDNAESLLNAYQGGLVASPVDRQKNYARLTEAKRLLSERRTDKIANATP